MTTPAPGPNEVARDHVAFPTDDEPEGAACPYLHVLTGGGDYYLAVGPGKRWPSTRRTFRACTSGARSDKVTALVAALYKLGRGDLDGAIACARAFIDQCKEEKGR